MTYHIYIYESNHLNGFNNWNVDFQHATCTSVASRAQEKTQGEIEHQNDKRAESREQVGKLAGRQAGRQAGERAALSHREAEPVAEAVNGRKTSTEIVFL